MSRNRTESDLGGIPFKFFPTSDANLKSMTLPDFDEGIIINRFINGILPSDVFLDVGAHTGSWSIPISLRMGESGRVFSIEANKRIHDALKFNFELNNIKNIVLLNYAASSHDHICEFFDRDFSELGSIYSMTVDPEVIGGNSLFVQARSIDSLLQTGQISRPTLMKIDVEGAELDVLRGSEACLQEVRMISVEIHEPVLSLSNRSSSDVRAALEGAGFYVSTSSSGMHLVGER